MTKQSQRAKDRARQAAFNGSKKPAIARPQMTTLNPLQRAFQDQMMAEMMARHESPPVAEPEPAFNGDE